VHDNSRAGIFSLLRVNKLFHHVALPFIVRECALCFDVEDLDSSHARIERWLEADSPDAWVIAKIRYFTVFGTPDNGVVSYDEAEYKVAQKMKWSPVLRLIPFLRNLHHFTFACPQDRIPVKLLRALKRNHARVTLSVKHWGLGEGRNTTRLAIDPDEIALIRSPLLHGIQLDHQETGEVEYVVLQWIVAHSHSHHLTSLVISPPPEGTAKKRIDLWMREHIFARRVSSVFTMPSDLPKHKFHRLHLLPCSETFADFCIQVAEPTSLIDLQCFFPLAHLIKPETFHQLTALCQLVLRVGDSKIDDEVITQLEGLLVSCGPLESLTLSSPSPLNQVLPVIAEHHGSSLLSLTLLHTPLNTENYDVVPPSASDIRFLKKCCPRLQQLGVTTARGQALTETLEGLSGFASLADLTLVLPENPCVMDRSGQFYNSFAEQASFPGHTLNDWEASVRLQLPVHPSFAATAFKDLVEKACLPATLRIKLGDQAVRTTAQEFVVEVGRDGKAKVTAKGYNLPGYINMDWVLDTEPSKLERLRRLWDCLLPNEVMPGSLMQVVVPITPGLYGYVSF
ncbi:hypothetical protein DL96DRAFT_1623644, partial [Flagelloscypha sp. PMI_526]